MLIGRRGEPIATGGHSWENQLQDGVWTYDLADVWTGLQQAYAALSQEVQRNYGTTIRQLAALGISGMMHGYLPFDAQEKQLAPFRTWRNTMTGEASDALSGAFDFHIPQRWSVAHLYQAILKGEEHVPRIDYLTTLAGYVHWQLTGQKVLGVGEASGMFPIDATGAAYDAGMLSVFNGLVKEKGYAWRLGELLPQLLVAGQSGGRLTAQGARLIDPAGNLQPGVPMCPPEGDAGTGMVATNSVAQRTGNISAGTSIFLMAVLEKALSRNYPQIDMVTTPAGRPVAMVHCNNCTTDLNKWVKVFEQFAAATGMPTDTNRVYEAFFEQALHGAADGGGLLSYGYYSGEHITGFEEGRPLLAWTPEADLSFASLARTILFTALGTLGLGMEILSDERVQLDQLVGHGGLYRTGTAGQRFTAAALKAPVTVMDHAGEGGAWGIALLAAYAQRETQETSLEQYLQQEVFSALQGTTIAPDPADVTGFETYLRRFRRGLAIERAAVDHLG